MEGMILAEDVQFALRGQGADGRERLAGPPLLQDRGATYWQVATEEVKRQCRARDRVRERERTQFLTQARILYQYTPSKPRYLSQVDAPRKRYRRIKLLQLQHGCNSCGYGQLGGLPNWYHLCPCCHKPLNQEKSLQLELIRQL